MSHEKALAGVKVVIDAGPTYEDIDPVRFLGNRSSGKMGFAIAEACVAEGADVILIAGPVALATPSGVARRVDVRSALQMRDAVLQAVGDADIFIDVGGDVFKIRHVNSPWCLVAFKSFKKFKPFKSSVESYSVISRQRREIF